MRSVKFGLSVALLTWLGCELSPTFCLDYVEQGWELGEFTGEFSVPDSVVHIGDSLQFTMTIPTSVTDTNGRELLIDRYVDIFIKITTELLIGPGDTTSVFARDTTIINVFDEHFDTYISHGTMVNAYIYRAELLNEQWTVDVIYVPRQAGAYSAYLSILQLDGTALDLPDNQCRESTSAALGAHAIWKQSALNRIDTLFGEPANTVPEYFGFIVE